MGPRVRTTSSLSLLFLAAACSGGGSGGGPSTDPTLAITGPGPLSSSATVDVSVVTDPAGQALEASLDGAAFAAVASPWQLTNLTDGDHELAVRVVGVPSSASTIEFLVDTTAPTPPSGLALTVLADGTLDVDWTSGADAGSGVVSHLVEFAEVGDTVWSTLEVPGATANTTSLDGLAPCQRLSVRVSCTDAAGHSSVTSATVVGRVRCGATGTFDVSTTTLGSVILAVATGDFDDDGILDLALGSATELAVLLGNGVDGRGDGTFTPGTSHDVGSFVVDIAVGDVDADGIDDLVVSDRESLEVFLGEGADGVGLGTFLPASTITTNIESIEELALADVDADGILDIVVVDRNANELRTFLGGGSGGRGDGTFTHHSSAPTGTFPSQLALGDFDSDGITDVAVGCDSGVEDLVTHLGNGAGGRGDGTFGAPTIQLAGGFLSGDVLVADVDMDGVEDLLVPLTIADNVAVLFGAGLDGRGNGNFFLQQLVPSPARPGLALRGDFDGDLIPDLFVASQNGSGVALLVAGGAGGRGDGSFTTSALEPTDARASDGAVGDFDGDGVLDLVFGTFDGELVTYTGQGAMPLPSGTLADRGFDQWLLGSGSDVVAGDFDGDQVPDLAVASFDFPNVGGADFVTVLRGTEDGGRGTGEFEVASNNPVGTSPFALEVGDFDHDAILDLVSVAADLELLGGGERVDVLLGDGAAGQGEGTFTAGSSVAVGNTPRATVSGDFDADGILDLAVANHGSDSVTVLTGQGADGVGDGTFVAGPPIATPTGPFALVAGDFDRDGILDLAVAHVDGAGAGGVSVLLGQGNDGRGDGTFTAGVLQAGPSAATDIVAHDFDGDGILDLATANYAFGGASPTNGVTVWLGGGTDGRGDGTFAATPVAATGGNPRALDSEDLDGDRVLDLVVGDIGAGVAFVLLGNGADGRGDGTFGAATSVTLASPSSSVVCRDVDGDGLVDVVSAGDDRLSLRFGTRR